MVPKPFTPEVEEREMGIVAIYIRGKLAKVKLETCFQRLVEKNPIIGRLTGLDAINNRQQHCYLVRAFMPTTDVHPQPGEPPLVVKQAHFRLGLPLTIVHRTADMSGVDHDTINVRQLPIIFDT